MKNKSEKNIIYYHRKMIIVLIMSLLFLPCCSRSEKNKIIPEDDFYEILYEVSLANGLMIVPEVRNTFSGRDTSRHYYDIVENYGYSVEQMENTLLYYFTRKPKKLIRLYDKAIGKMSEMASIIRYDNTIVPDGREDLWKNETTYYLPDTTSNKKLCFGYELRSPGRYTLEFSTTVYPCDQSFNPHFSAFTCHADSVGNGVRTVLPEFKYIKDGREYQYRTFLLVEKNKPLYLRVFLYDHDNNPENMIPLATIKGISLFYSP